MNLQTSVSNPVLMLFLIVLLTISLGYALYFYKKAEEEFTGLQRKLLFTVKFVYSFLITILLLAPLYEVIKTRMEKPLLIVGIDNSESIATDSSQTQFVFDAISGIQSNLGEKFQIETLLFGSEVQKGTRPDFSRQKSNYSNFFTEIDKRFYNLNTGAIVLIGDGIYNEGRNPEQYQSKLRTPVYTVGIGDTLTYLDQAIADVTHNPNVFLGNTFPIEIQLNFTEFNNPSTQLSIYQNGKLQISENIDVLQPNFYYVKTYEIKAEDVGLKNIEVVLSPLSNEQNKENNRKRFTIEVHDNKKNILILTQGPHPDIGAITQTLNQKANFNISNFDINLFNGKISDYDLVVLNQLPTARNQNNPLYEELKLEQTPVLAIVGPQTSVTALNNLQLGFQLEPTLLSEESTPFFNLSFPLFSLHPGTNDVQKVYPPLITHYTNYTFDNTISVLAYQKINDIEMNHPLMLAGTKSERKVAAILGEGIWRWRIHEFQNYNNQNVFNQLVVNLFNYLTIIENRDRFQVTYDRICSETLPVKLKAQLFNEIFEPVNNAEIRLILKDSTNTEYNYVFDANKNDYALNLGLLLPGSYTFEASTSLGDDAFYKTGTFNVQEVNIERQNLHANFTTLKLIAANSNGAFYPESRFSSLINDLKSTENIKPKSHKEKSIHELIDIKWFVLLIMLLLSLEWFLRKFWGSY